MRHSACFPCLLLLLACSPKEPADTSSPDSNPSVDSLDSVDSGGDSWTDTPPYEEFDCSNLPSPPFEARILSGMASEDLVFDDEGNLIGSDMTHIWKSRYDGSRQLFVPNFPFRAGMRRLTNGQLVVADNNNGAIVLVNPDGSRSEVVTGLDYPNGIEIGRNDQVFFSEHGARRVWHLDPSTLEATVIADVSIMNPNGLTFNADFSALYIGGFSGVGAIYEIPFDEDGNPGDLQLFTKAVGTGWLDGMGVDICGNVYVADYGVSRIVRLPPDGSSWEYILDGMDFADTRYPYLPNMQWGSGFDGWDPLKLYIPEGSGTGQIYEIDLGLPSKVR